MYPRLLILSLPMYAFLAIASPVSAEELLTAEETVKILVDDRPWNALTADGMRAKITYNKDGTGKFEGPFTMATTWRIEGQDLCLKISIAGTKCHRFRQDANSYRGFLGQTLDLTLTR